MAAFAATAAFADATLYGNLDVGLNHSTNGSSQVEGAGQWDTSLWGIKGSEDLGGGLKSFYQLEGGLQVANGSNGVNGGSDGLFNREANVGLSGSFGSVKLGTTINPMVLENAMSFGPGFNLGFFAPSLGITNQVGVSNGQQDGFFDSNTVSYTTPNINGFQGSVFTAYNANSASSTDVTASYTNGPIRVGAGYETVGSGAIFYTDAAHTLAKALNIQHTGYVVDASYNQPNWNVGVAFNSTNWAVGSDFIGSNTALTSATRLSSTTVNASYLVSPALRLIGNYTVGNAATGADSSNGAKLTQVALQYSLSKQTKVYAFVNEAQNGAAGNFTNFSGYGVKSDSTATQSVTVVGLGLSKGF